MLYKEGFAIAIGGMQLKLLSTGAGEVPQPVKTKTNCGASPQRNATSWMNIWRNTLSGKSQLPKVACCMILWHSRPRLATQWEILSTTKAGLCTYICNSSSGEAETGGPWELCPTILVHQ